MSSRGPKRGRNRYVTPAFSGVPNAKRGDKIRSGTSPVPSRGPKRRRNCYVTPTFSGVPYAKRGGKLKIAHLTRGFSRAQKRGELLRNPYILGDPQCQARGQNQK